jgi:lysozyme
MKYRTISTETEAAAALMVDMDATARGVLKRLKICVSQNQFDALVSHAYNCGYSGTMYTLVNGRATEKSIKNWFTSKYITSRGVFLLGLQYRRNDEYEIWAGINYKREYKRSI